MGGLFKTALAGWWNDRAMSLGAAIAFFTVFWFERGSIERRYAHFRALQARLDGTVAQVRQLRCEIVS